MTAMTETLLLFLHFCEYSFIYLFFFLVLFSIPILFFFLRIYLVAVCILTVRNHGGSLGNSSAGMGSQDLSQHPSQGAEQPGHRDSPSPEKCAPPWGWR